MKKTYIEPKNTVVKLNLEQIMCLSEVSGQSAKTYDPIEVPEVNGGDGLAREVIDAPDAWEEW